MVKKRNSGRRKRRTHGEPAEAPSRGRRRRPANKGQRYPAEILTVEEMRALITACSNRAPTGVRNRALLVLLYRAGCRISEALHLRSKDLDRAAGTVTVLRGKGGTRRTIGLDPGAFAVVERWLDVRAKLGSGYSAAITPYHRRRRSRWRLPAHARGERFDEGREWRAFQPDHEAGERGPDQDTQEVRSVIGERVRVRSSSARPCAACPRASPFFAVVTPVSAAMNVPFRLRDERAAPSPART
jgi:hypothetical protein